VPSHARSNTSAPRSRTPESAPGPDGGRRGTRTTASMSPVDPTRIDEPVTAAEPAKRKWVLQFIDGAAGRAAVRLEVTTGAPIEAPADATKIDTDALGTLGATGAYVSEPGGTSAVSMAKMLGYEAQDLAEENGGKPADALKGAVKAMDGAPFTARIVRRGVAEVTVKGEKACLTVPSSVDDDPAVVKGAC
jgi:hypothetical protein